MEKYRKRPVVIEAVRYVDEASGEKILAWTKGSATPAFLTDPVPSDGPGLGMTLRVKTLESGKVESMIVSLGDWVIRGVHGEHYPCKPDIFDATYDVVAAAPTGPIHVLWFTSKGGGPDEMFLELQPLEELRNPDGVRLIAPATLGLRVRAGELVILGAALIDGGFQMDRSQAQCLHDQIGAWLAEHPEQP